ncbi:DUF6415 family natural product biosynthesis protein [Streptomyces sp. NPDC004787]|uniref:DUF6415 family natural product biosynthesis protein n=1 Tax=Streptomyces sp. NPDC004787 TaxID=3154291 RepID=UPI0033A8AEC5
MRETARRVLETQGAPSSMEELDLLIRTMRGHIELLVPEISTLVAAAPPGDGPAICARIGAAEAVRRLRRTRGFDPDGVKRHATKLALSVLSLCDHSETLTRTAAAPPMAAAHS